MHWQLTDSSAIGSVETGQIEVFPTEPSRSARLQIGSDPRNSWAFAAVHPSPQHSKTVEEVYSRQRDLICRYGQTASDSFAFQLDWQLLPANGPFVLGTELWLSIQTALLDTQPELDVTCTALDSDASAGDQPAGQFGQTPGWRVLAHREISEEPLAGETDHCGPAAMICTGRRAGNKEPLTGLWLIEPTDQRHARVCPSAVNSHSDSAPLCVRLFGHFMEKGVIRRGRMRFLVASGPVDRADIVEAYRQFAHSPLPLTA